jgi:hypothetical protein
MTQTPEQMRKEAARLAMKADNETISRSLEGRIAVALHDSLCGYDHTEGCSWFYEISPDTGAAWKGQYSAHEHWRMEARKLLLNTPYEKHLLPMETA